jgi:hypothetical protein
MNINLLFETLLFSFSILISNGFIYSLKFLNKSNSSENISVIRNNSEKDVIAPTLLIASNPLSITSSESSISQTSLETSISQTSLETSTSQTLSVTSSALETSTSQTLSVTSSASETSFSSFENTFDNEDIIDTELSDRMITYTQNSILSSTEPISPDVDVFVNTTSLDSLTILDGPSLEYWRETAMILHSLPTNTPAGILQQIKFEELNILYSQDIIQYGITQTELRLIIEHLPAISLFKPEINHLILTIMSYYHL